MVSFDLLFVTLPRDRLEVTSCGHFDATPHDVIHFCVRGGLELGA